MIEIIVRGSPAPQGSKSFKGMRGGHGVLVESSKAVKPWRESVKWAAIEAMRVQGVTCPLDGPLRALMVFTLRKPAGAPKRKQSWPDRKPDLSKLIRSTEDALVDASVIADDARIVEFCDVAKGFPLERAHTLDVPGVLIRLWRIAA
jgi:crossover junction endodeoxyribonuclease RusA